MSDTFIRYIDNSVIWRINDELKLSVARVQYCYDHIDIGTDWRKTGDAPIVRRWDNDTLLKLPDFPLKRPEDNATVERPTASDTFIRSA